MSRGRCQNSCPRPGENVAQTCGAVQGFKREESCQCSCHKSDFQNEAEHFARIENNAFDERGDR